MSRNKKKPAISVRRAGSLPSLSVPQVLDEKLAASVIGDQQPEPPKEIEAPSTFASPPLPSPETAETSSPTPPDTGTVQIDRANQPPPIADSEQVEQISASQDFPKEPPAEKLAVEESTSATPKKVESPKAQHANAEKTKEKSRKRASKLPPPEIMRGARAIPAQNPEDSWAARHKKVMWECPRDLLSVLDEYRAKGYSKNAIITAAVRAYLDVEAD